jgi:peptidyl-prolyl cis-trans isomerase-like protein 2
VVGGFDALSAIERVPTDKEDRPTELVSISGITVLVDPFETLAEEMQAAHAREADPAGAAAADQAERAAQDAQAWYNGPVSRPKALREGVGKYISTQHLQGQVPRADAREEEARPPKRAKPAVQGYELSNFSGW